MNESFAQVKNAEQAPKRCVKREKPMRFYDWVIKGQRWPRPCWMSWRQQRKSAEQPTRVFPHPPIPQIITRKDKLHEKCVNREMTYGERRGGTMNPSGSGGRADQKNPMTMITTYLKSTMKETPRNLYLQGASISSQRNNTLVSGASLPPIRIAEREASSWPFSVLCTNMNQEKEEQLPLGYQCKSKRKNIHTKWGEKSPLGKEVY